MQIPSAWAKATGTANGRDGRQWSMAAWGWGDDATSASRVAESRLRRLLERVQRGDPFPERYAYGARPIREELLQTFDGATGTPRAVITRNGYGAQILNAARVLFLDVDLPAPTPWQRLRHAVRFGPDAESEAVARLRAALAQFGGATFRIYRTASGLRAMAIDRAFDPTNRDTQDLMVATRTDPAFAKLCIAQNCFRARLTPKPWRCGMSGPPVDFPRSDAQRQHFADWLSQYELASTAFATCRYLETVGNARPRGDARELVSVHDRLTRAAADLPLA
jgi:hypothetical protein